MIQYCMYIVNLELWVDIYAVVYAHGNFEAMDRAWYGSVCIQSH